MVVFSEWFFLSHLLVPWL